MIRTLIVDDEAPARDKLRRWLGEEDDVEVLGEEADGLSAARSIASSAPDLVFLDIQMPLMTGLEVAAQIQSTAAPLIVFVTAYGDHALAAFDLNAIDYLLKPYDKERLVRTLARVRTRLTNPELRARPVAVARQQTGGSDRLLVPDGERLQIVESRTILWIETDDNYVDLHTRERAFRIRRTLQDVLAQLDERQFIRIHKSCAVNVAEIQALHPLFKGDYEVELRGGQRLRLSRRYREALFARMGK